MYKEIKLSEIPESLDLEITSELSNYAVALGTVRNNRKETFRSNGSAVLVKKGDRYGILTAHHCIHGTEPPLSIGPNGNDGLIFMLRMGRLVKLEPFELIEIPLKVIPFAAYNEYGPDLTFIEIPQGPKLSQIKAISAFWNLDKDLEAIKGTFGSTQNVLVNTGFPHSESKTRASEDRVDFHEKFMSYIGSIEPDDIEIKCDWDYVTSRCDYVFQPELPHTFKGISGGGIWSVRLKYTESTKTWEVLDFCLVGINFWGNVISEKRIDIKGHYINSIYSTYWKKV